MSEPNWLNETEQDAWRGLLCLVNRGFPQIDRTFKEHDLIGVHYSILVALSEAPGLSLRLSDLADVANVSPSRLTHRMRTLVDRGLVGVGPDPDDRRAKQATLLPPGIEWLEAVAPVHVAVVRQIIFDHLTPDEVDVFATGLARINAELCDLPPEERPVR